MRADLGVCGSRPCWSREFGIEFSCASRQLASLDVVDFPGIFFFSSLFHFIFSFRFFSDSRRTARLAAPTTVFLNYITAHAEHSSFSPQLAYEPSTDT